MSDSEQPPGAITRIDLSKDTEAFYRLGTSSSTVYYVRTHEGLPRLYRARGAEGSSAGFHDDQWVRLVGLESLPLHRSEGQAAEAVSWTLRVGHRHRFDYRVPGGYGDTTDYWQTQRVLERVEILDEMPPEGERATEARIPRPPSEMPPEDEGAKAEDYDRDAEGV